MPLASNVQTSFLGGQISVQATGRFDHPKYQIALSVCLNALPIEEGACPRRSGTIFPCTTRGGVAGRLIPFAFSASAPYAMEFTDGHLRFMKGESLLLEGFGDPVSNISTASPAVVTVTASVAPPWVTGDQFLLNALDAATAEALPQLANRTFVATQNSPFTFSIADAVTGAAIDGSTLSAWNSSFALQMIRIIDIVTPWTGTKWSSVRAVQSENKTLLLQATVAPRTLSEATIAGTPSFTLATTTFLDGPYLDAPTDGATISADAVSGLCNLQFSAITSVNGGAGFTTADIGRQIRLYSQPADYNNAVSYVVGEQVMYLGFPYICIQNALAKPPTAAPTFWVVNPISAQWEWAIITSITSTSHVVASLQTGLLYLAVPIVKWRLGVYSDGTGYPTCGVYYQGRIWLGGAVANRFDACMSNIIDPPQFSPTAPDGTVTDQHAISYTLNDDSVNPILWMIGGLQGVNMGTPAGEWLVSAGGTGPITPTNIKADPVTKYGCADVEPRRTGLTVVFVQKLKRKLVEYLSDMFSGKFFGPNLAEFTKGITKSGIAELAFQKELAPVMWMRMGDGSLAGTTYQRISNLSSEPPLFNGWHQHALGSGRTVESICVGPTLDGTLEQLTMITNDAATNVRHIEVMKPLFEEGDALTSAWFLDDAVTPSAAVTVIHANTTYVRLHGLWHLNGKTVSAFVGGLDCGDFTVTDGYIEVPYGSADGAFTADYLVSLSGGSYGTLAVNLDNGRAIFPAVVGFSFTTQVQALRTIDPKEAGTRSGPAFGKAQRAHQYAMLVTNTVQGAVKVGTSFSLLRTANLLTAGKGGVYPSNTLYTGLHQDTVEDSYSFESQLCWQITRPWPTTMLAFGAFQATQDR